MPNSTAEDYSQYADANLDDKLQPIYQSIDEMLARLEEFESMVALVQQKRCGAIGITGALIEAMDMQKSLTELCARIDALEKLVEYVKANVDGIERQLEAAEEQFGLVDGANKLKNFFLPLFKKQAETKSPSPAESSKPFCVNRYFLDGEQ